MRYITIKKTKYYVKKLKYSITTNMVVHKVVTRYNVTTKSYK